MMGNIAEFLAWVFMAILVLIFIMAAIGLLLEWNGLPQLNIHDVPASHANADAIYSLYRNGLVTGCDADNFCPELRMTRGQVAVILVRMTESASFTPAGGTAHFVDSHNHWASDWIEHAFMGGLMESCGVVSNLDYFCPDSPATRGDIAQLIMEAR